MRKKKLNQLVYDWLELNSPVPIDFRIIGKDTLEVRKTVGNRTFHVTHVFDCLDDMFFPSQDVDYFMREFVAGLGIIVRVKGGNK